MTRQSCVKKHRARPIAYSRVKVTTRQMSAPSRSEAIASTVPHKENTSTPCEASRASCHTTKTVGTGREWSSWLDSPAQKTPSTPSFPYVLERQALLIAGAERSARQNCTKKTQHEHRLAFAPTAHPWSSQHYPAHPGKYAVCARRAQSYAPPSPHTNTQEQTTRAGTSISAIRGESTREESVEPFFSR